MKKLNLHITLQIILIWTLSPLTYSANKTNSFNYLEKAKLVKNENKIEITFLNSNTKRSRFLKLIKPTNASYKSIKINGKKIEVPLPNVSYEVLTGIPGSIIKQGKNTIEITSRNKSLALKNFKLVTVNPDELEFLTVPIIGNASQTGFRVTCRLNLPATVLLSINNKTLVSKHKLFHSFIVTGLKGGKTYSYRMKAKCFNKTIQTKIYKFTSYDPNHIVFSILGDTRGSGKMWQKMAEAAASEIPRPMFAVHSGDMVTTGYIDKQWLNDFVWGGRNVFPEMPYYLVNGNHDRESSWITTMFSTPTDPSSSAPNGGIDWSHRVGPVLIVATSSVQALEKMISRTDAEFIFLCSHVPAYSSGTHGSSKSAQKLLAVLEKYKGTAMFSGHDHAYERSEPKSGVSVIVTGGAGAPLYGAIKGSNPLSKIFKKIHHYCTLTVKGKHCSLVVKDLNGNIIDSHAWKARSLK